VFNGFGYSAYHNGVTFYHNWEMGPIDSVKWLDNKMYDVMKVLSRKKVTVPQVAHFPCFEQTLMEMWMKKHAVMQGLIFAKSRCAAGLIGMNYAINDLFFNYCYCSSMIGQCY
jgi:hypothetical protein